MGSNVSKSRYNVTLSRSEELDLPPPPRLGEAEEDLVSTGLLRAYGLRL